MVNKNYKSVGREYFGATEDEWNNFLIDCWDSVNVRVNGDRDKPQYHYWDAGTNDLVVSDKPIQVIITLKNHE